MPSTKKASRQLVSRNPGHYNELRSHRYFTERCYDDKPVTNMHGTFVKVPFDVIVNRSSPGVYGTTVNHLAKADKDKGVLMTLCGKEAKVFKHSSGWRFENEFSAAHSNGCTACAKRAGLPTVASAYDRKTQVSAVITTFA